MTTTDSMKQLEQQVEALFTYCQQLKQENIQLQARNQKATAQLKKLLDQFKSMEEPNDSAAE